MRRVIVAVVGLTIVIVLGSAQVAGANAVTTGDCHGSGHWEGSGQDETSAEHSTSDVIEVPRADTVDWEGALDGHQLGDTVARRDIDGKVEVKLPFGWVTIDSWSGSSVRAANEGTHAYDLPSVLIGVKLKLHGIHKDAGKVTCEGSVYAKVTGSAFKNPLAYVGLVGMALSAAGLALAGRPVFTKVAPAFEDTNPG